MELLRFTGLECHYGSREVFSDASGVLRDGERIGLVGSNGAGKSSLLRLLAGIDQPFGGTIARARGAALGYLAQGVADETDATLQQLVDAAIERAGDEEAGLRAKTLRTMLAAFGFSSQEYDRPLRGFSGGQRAKAALAHLLIDRPEYLILDEPTNHLDIATVRWLESFVARDKRGYIVVSHDRYFLDRVATRMWEIDRGKLYAYEPAPRAYTAYLEQKAIRLENERRAYAVFVADREKRRATIAGLRATHRSSDYSQVRSREKQLARVEGSADVPLPPPAAPRSIGVRFDSSRPAGTGFAFEVRGISKSYARPVIADLTFNVERGQRLAVVGPNGSGKSTLLKMLAGELELDAGSIRYNPAARVAYFAQNSHEQLDLSKSAVEAVLEAGSLEPEEARSLLGAMLISGDAADKPVRNFSGGERRRIMLATLMGREADVLLLDEPTNDLDIDSREALERVLRTYEGSIVVVSHDRYLLSSLCERVLWIENGEWGLVEGGYDAYESLVRDRESGARDRTIDDAETRPKASRETPLRIRSRLESQIARAEREIQKLDERAAEIEGLLAQPDVYSDHVRVAALQRELEDARTRSQELMSRWEAWHDELGCET
ncbi:MAG: ABC-F family ATP-binding cassette domain-containing protein [Candidatus Eremiobacteraeota bacterium]|nr:ABC-F family ATP-binding cassette domain-containing protein [Candidatus Eremiobacteraeota bacterium]